MLWQRIVVYSALFGYIFAVSASAQPGDRSMKIKARVLNLVYPLDDVTKPYLLKLILRFGDSDTQIVIAIYPGGKGEIINYSISGMKNGNLDRLISNRIAENPAVNEQEIAAGLNITASRSAIDYKELEPAIDELKRIQISPILANRISVGETSEYEFWCDEWQESVHYTITGPFNNTSQDKLVQWMIKFRANLSTLGKK
jgi:hypothetical protein